MRWMKRLAPFGAPTWMTRSTSPQSMPRSSVEVATTARSEPAAIAASTLRRCSGVERAVMQRDRQPELVDAPQLLEQQLGLHARVDEQQAQPVRLDRRVDLADGIARRVADRRHRLVELENVDLRLGSAADQHEVGHLDARLRSYPAARDRRAARKAAPPLPTARPCAAPAPACAAAPAIERSRSPRLVAASACSSSRTTVSRSANRSALSGWLSSSVSCSGVVIRMSGGRGAAGARRATEVSPVRVSVLIGNCISSMGAMRLRATSTASAFSGEI